MLKVAKRIFARSELLYTLDIQVCIEMCNDIAQHGIKRKEKRFPLVFSFLLLLAFV